MIVIAYIPPVIHIPMSQGHRDRVGILTKNLLAVIKMLA